MKQVIVMRGIPGAGKDHVAGTLVSLAAAQDATSVVFSADDYFTYGPDEVYRFDPRKLQEAHASCFRRFMAALPGSGGMSPNDLAENLAKSAGKLIIVSNTNIHAWECAPYMMAAQAYGWDCKIVTVLCPPEKAYERGTHGVPFGTIERMHRDLTGWAENGGYSRLSAASLHFPKHWKMEEVQNG